MSRLRRPPPLLVDSVLALAVAGLTWGTMLLNKDCTCVMPAWAVPVVLGQSLPLALRRRWPVAVWLVVGIVTSIHGASELVDPPLSFGGVVAVYTVASRCGRRTSYTVAAVTAACIAGAILVSRDTPWVTTAFLYAVFATAWILGDSVRVHRAHAAELEERARRLERDREEDARRAAAAERVRMARELHDVVAHHVSVIALQSQAAEVLLPDDPARAAEAVGAIGVTARQALGELRRMVGALRQEGDEAGRDGNGGLTPQPGVSDLSELVQAVVETGLAVRLEIVGEPRPLPPGVDLSAYRIVQEALTNVLKHARAGTASVVLRYGDAELGIRVVDDGAPHPTDGPAAVNGHGGHGLIGMRERVGLFDGTLAAGPRPDGRGFLVEATLPISTP
jgi:signal transduction histidine kinase